MIKYLTRYLKTCSSEFFFIEATLYLRNDVKEAKREPITHTWWAAVASLSAACIRLALRVHRLKWNQRWNGRERETEKEERDRERELKNALNERKPTLPCLILVKGLVSVRSNAFFRRQKKVRTCEEVWRSFGLY